MGFLNGLIEYWKMDEASGNRAPAYASHTLTVTEAAVAADTGLVYGNAARFTGDVVTPYEYLKTASGSGGGDDFSLTGAKTFAFWHYITSAGDGTVLVPAEHSVPNSHVGWYFLKNSSICGFNIGNISQADTTVPALNTWHLYIGWFDPTVTANGTVYFQLDNNSVISTTMASAYTPTTGTLVAIGDSSFTGEQHRAIAGRLGPFMAWSRVLTTQERTDLYNGGAGVAFSAFTLTSEGLPFITQLDSRRI